MKLILILPLLFFMTASHSDELACYTEGQSIPLTGPVTKPAPPLNQNGFVSNPATKPARPLNDNGFVSNPVDKPQRGASHRVYYEPKCCDGLVLVKPPAGVMGSRGTCQLASNVVEQRACFKDGESIPVTANSQNYKCCDGLVLSKPPAGVMGSRGKCVKEEGGSRSVSIDGCDGGEMSYDGQRITCPNGSVYRLSRDESYGIMQRLTHKFEFDPANDNLDSSSSPRGGVSR